MDIHRTMNISEEKFAEMKKQFDVWRTLKTPVSDALMMIEVMENYTPREKIFFAFMCGVILNRRVTGT